MDFKKLQKMIGGLGFVLVMVSAAWWVAVVDSYTGNDVLKYANSCLYWNGRACHELPPDASILFWIGIVLLTISTVLRFSQKSAPTADPDK